MKHKFIEFIPENLEDNTLYISVEYKTVAHLCCCGCKNEVITPITPTDWTLIYNGDSISLDPSIGNWDFKCRSHYWIKNNAVVWSGECSKEQIALVKRSDMINKDMYYKSNEESGGNSKKSSVTIEQGFLSKLFSWLYSKK